MEAAIERVERIRAALRFRSRLRDEGVSDREMHDAVRRNEWVKVAHGVYALRDQWVQWHPVERHLARALAVDHASRRKRIFSHLTASAILGLPAYMMERERVHVAVEHRESAQSTRSIAAHVRPLKDMDVVDVGGLWCTSLTLTMLDVARTARADQSVVCLDAGLRQMFGSQVVSGQKEWRSRQLRSLDPLRGQRGVRAARRIVEFADGRADSPAESLSRLQLDRLGYETEIQVEVHTERGTYRVDFEFIGLGVFGEVDGESKYTDPEMLGGRSTAQAVLNEKYREDLVSGTRRARFVRWGFRESRTAEALGARLRSFGVHPRT